MTKVMLVEDDNNLREIYGARLAAEGYDIVAAKDGEEALALAVQEKPDLIISDVMMPRISGFDMLDILRNAPETKNTKVIMMTALSQAEDKSRADKLGADRYLVKSQVTLEDVANVVREVLNGDAPGSEVPAPEPAPTPPAPVDDTILAATPVPTPEPVQPQPQAVTDPTPIPIPEPVPEVTPAPVDEIPVPPAPSSVEALANPALEVHDEQDPTQVQTPPQDEAPVPAPTPLITDPIPVPAPPAPEPVLAAPTIPNPEVVPVAEPTTPTTPVVTQPVDDLPPIVAPAQPIKVDLPQQASVPAPDPTPVTVPVVEEPEEPEAPADFIGPNLAQALASEEAGSADDNQVSPTPVPTPPTPTEVPVVTNGAPSTTVIAPTEPVPAAPEAPAAPDPQPNANIAGMRVIQPINTTESSPDINELLANEERKAAIANPVANTVITPEGSTQTGAGVATNEQPLDVKQPPKNDEFNNIAL